MMAQWLKNLYILLYLSVMVGNASAAQVHVGTQMSRVIQDLVNRQSLCNMALLGGKTCATLASGEVPTATTDATIGTLATDGVQTIYSLLWNESHVANHYINPAQWAARASDTYSALLQPYEEKITKVGESVVRAASGTASSPTLFDTSRMNNLPDLAQDTKLPYAVNTEYTGYKLSPDVSLSSAIKGDIAKTSMALPAFNEANPKP